MEQRRYELNKELAQMLKGGVIMEDKISKVLENIEGLTNQEVLLSKEKNSFSKKSTDESKS